jgi:hypothetical protein
LDGHNEGRSRPGLDDQTPDQAYWDKLPKLDLATSNKFFVRPELPTSSSDLSQATAAAVDNAALFAIQQSST